MAIIESGQPVWLLVVRNCEPGSADVTDWQRKRTISDALYMRGEANTHKLASTIKFLHNYRATEKRRFYSPGLAVDSRIAVEMLNNEPIIREAIAVTHKSSSDVFRNVSRSLMAALYVELSAISYSDAQQFFRKLIDGDNLSANDPVCMLRNRLIIESQRGSMGSLNSQFQGALMIRAWNAMRSNEPISRLTYIEGKDLPKPI